MNRQRMNNNSGRDLCTDVKLKWLSIRSKGFIANKLEGLEREFGLKLGLLDDEVTYFLQCCNPVYEMICAVGDQKTTENLLRVLIDLEPPDIDGIRERIDHDIAVFNKRDSMTVSLPKVNPPQKEDIPDVPHVLYEMPGRCRVQYTVPEALHIHNGEYDAYISCSMKDKVQVMKVLRKLEQCNLKCCLPQRDLLAGLAIPTVTPDLILNRCRFAILFLSPNFFKSKEECMFHTELVTWHSAGHLRKRYLLVKLSDYEDTIPAEHFGFAAIFSGVHRLDMSRRNPNRNWDLEKLKGTLQNAGRHW